jgi:hypothetical protein
MIVMAVCYLLTVVVFALVSRGVSMNEGTESLQGLKPIDH